MNSESPGWQPVDPSGASLSAALPEAPRSGEVVVFASIASEDQQEWAAGTVAEMVREWAAAVDRLLLMDLDLQGPGIHRALDAAPAEGTSDVLLFGASLSRVSQALDGGAFHFAPAGTPVADPSVILSNSGWNRVIQGLEETGVALVLHLPLRQSGAPSILDRADRIIQLGRSVEDGQGIRSQYEDRVVARLAPPDLAAGPVVDIASLAPDPIAPAPEGGGETSAPVANEPMGASGADAPVGSTREGEVVDIRSLAPDSASAEPAAEAPEPEEPSAPEGPPVPGGLQELEEPKEPGGPAGAVVDIADLAPDESAEGIDEEPLPDRVDRSEGAVESAVEEAAAEARSLSAEEPCVEIGEPEPEPEPEEGRVEAVEIEGGEAEIAGPVVEIGDLAPDEPVGVSRPPEESPAESGEVGFRDDEFAAGLDAIDAAAEAGKQTGLEGFDLEGLDELAETGGVPEDVEEAPEGSPGAEAEDEAIAFETEDLEEPLQAAPPPPRGEEPEDGFADVDGGVRADEDAFAPDEEDEEAFPSDEGAFAPDDEAFTSDDEESFAPDEESFAPDDEAFTTADADAFSASDQETDFGAFSGELDADETEIDHEEPMDFGEGLEGEEPTPGEDFGDAEGMSDADRLFEPGPFEEGPGTGETGGEDDLASDLVTGPDFGQSVSEGEEIWDEDEPAGGGTSATSPNAEGETGGGTSGPEAPDREGKDRKGDVPDDSGAGEPRLVGTEEATGPRRGPESGRPLRLLIIAVLVAVGAVSAHWYGVVDVPGLDRALGAILGPAGTGAAPTVDTSGPQPASPIQSRSLLIDVYRDGQSAGDVALALQERLPDRIFAVAPLQEDGDVIFRLLAGPADDAGEATALRETLAQVLTREDPSQWTPQGTSLAFVLDELPDPEAANARARAMTGGEVFAYVLPVSYPDGSTAHRVYAGGFSSAEEARALQGFLSQAGFGGATFTERRGEVPE